MTEPNSRLAGINLPQRDRDGAKRRAQNHFTVQAERDASVKRELAQEKAASDAKTAKLRALRLAKEETDREEARIAAENAPPKAAKKTVKKRKV